MTKTTSSTQTDPTSIADPAAEYAPAVGDLVQDEQGRYGTVVDLGREPNLEHRDRESNQVKPETREPVVLWLGFASPWGLPLSKVG